MDPQSKQFYILNSEIRLLEKKKRDITFDLERLDSTHKQAYTQNTQIINELSKRKTDLQVQIDQLREGLTLLTSAYEQAKESLEDFKNHKWKDAEEEIKKARETAKGIIEDAVAIKRDADLLNKAAKQKEEKLLELSKKLTEDSKQIVIVHESIDKSREEDIRRHYIATQEYDKLKKEIEIVRQNIVDHTRALEVLKEKIRDAEENYDLLRENLKEKFAESDRRVLEDKNRKELLDKKEEEQKMLSEKLEAKANVIAQIVKQLKERGVSGDGLNA